MAPSTSPAPDGGWGWVVVAACFVHSFNVASMARTFGVVIIELMHKFDSPSAQVAGVLSAAQFCRYIFSPLSGVAVHKFGYRPTVFFGATLASFGVILGAYSTSLFMLYVTYGAMTGLGHCFIFTPGNIVIGAYFEKRRAVATALSGVGASFSGFILPPLMRWFFVEYGFTGCLLILAGLTMNSCPAAMLLRPIQTTRKSKEPNDAELKSQEAFLMEEDDAAKPDDKSGIANPEPRRYCGKFLDWLGLDFSLLLHPPFLAFIVAHCLTNPTLSASWAFIPLLGISKGIPASRAAFLLSTHALADLIGGRLVSSVLLDSPWIRSRRYLLSPIVNLMFCVVMAGLYWSRSEIECFIWVGLYGIFHGIYVSLRSLVIQDLFGRDKLASIFSFNNCAIGVGMLTMPVVVGVIRDASDVGTSLASLAGVFFVGVMLFGGVAFKRWKTGSVAHGA